MTLERQSAESQLYWLHRWARPLGLRVELIQTFYGYGMLLGDDENGEIMARFGGPSAARVIELMYEFAHWRGG